MLCFFGPTATINVRVMGSNSNMFRVKVIVLVIGCINLSRNSNSNRLSRNSNSNRLLKYMK